MNLIETDKWCTSSNGEWFGSPDHSSREEAIAECKTNQTDSYIGRAVKIELTEFDVNAHEEDIIDDLRETLYEEIADAAENWELTAEEEIELSKRIAKTVIDYINESGNQPSCFQVVDIEEVEHGT